jgi:hypothetical protein
MKQAARAAIALAWWLVTTQPAHARNDKYILAIEPALQSSAAPPEKSDGAVKFFFTGQETPQVITTIGSGTTHQRARTNPSIDGKACNAAFLLALADLQKRAKQLGANAVTNIASYYKKNQLANGGDFECHAGAAAHVMLRGEFVKIADR